MVMSPTGSIRAILKSKTIPVIVSLVLLVLVFRSVNLGEIFGQLLAIPLWVNILYILLMLVVMLITSLRWQLILMQSASREHLRVFFAASMMALFYNLFLPSGNGGDILKWTFLSVLPHSKKKIIFSVLYDRLTGLSGLIFLGSISALLAVIFFKFVLPIPVLLAITGLFVGAIIFLFGSIAAPLLMRFEWFVRIKFIVSVLNFVSTRKKEVFLGVLLTMLSQFIFFLAIYLLSQSIGLPLNLLQFIVFGSIAFIISSLPISFSGFGTTELAFLYFFLPLGATRTQVLTLTTLLVVYKFVFAGIGWLIGTRFQASRLAYLAKVA